MKPINAIGAPCLSDKPTASAVTATIPASPEPEEIKPYKFTAAYTEKYKHATPAPLSA